MARTGWLAALALAGLAACGGGSDNAPPAGPAAPTGTPTLETGVWMSGLQAPWDIAFAPDGAMLFTERARGLSVRRPDGSVQPLFRPADLVAEGQSGMLGVAVDPAFAENRRVYVYAASNRDGATDNRVVRLVVDPAWTAVSQRTDIVTGIAYAGGAHSGGRIRFAPDGTLFIGTGDNRRGAVPQSTASLGGKVLRVTTDGTPPAGQVPPAGHDPRVYAVGFRNVQGLAFRVDDGRPLACEHGPGHSDEVTPLSMGGQGGWDPLCPDGVSYCGYSTDPLTPMTDVARFPDALPPAWTTGGYPAGAPGGSEGLSGCGALDGAAWRDWDGGVAVALLAGRRLEVLRFDTAGTTATATPALTLGERLRLAQQGPDGALYVLTDGRAGGDEIWRVVPR